MNPRLLGIATFRSLAMLFSLQKNEAASKTLNFIADGIQSGADVDAYMRDVATAQAAGVEPDWKALHDKINTEGETLQEKTSAGKSTATKKAKNGGPAAVEPYAGKSGKLEPPGGEPAPQTPAPDETVNDPPDDAPNTDTTDADPTADPASTPVDPEPTTGLANPEDEEEEEENDKPPTGMADPEDEDEEKDPDETKPEMAADNPFDQDEEEEDNDKPQQRG